MQQPQRDRARRKGERGCRSQVYSDGPPFVRLSIPSQHVPKGTPEGEEGMAKTLGVGFGRGSVTLLPSR
ncbi:hypothetical protein R1flu_007861 [Riccia fluitans]|uniref:Uncharacterized protein n=1 Tax=Riccia fluitans TaxID=41844 RepID=A0ABD1Z478_9MARC